MRHIPMTLPASSPHLHPKVFNLIILSTVDEHLGHRLPVTRDTIVLDPSSGIAADAKVGAVSFKGHGQGVIIPVTGLSQHFLGEGVAGQMAIDAGRFSPVRAVLPGIIVGVHGMTGDADLRVTGQIGQHLRLVHQIGKNRHNRDNAKYGQIFHSVTQQFSNNELFCRLVTALSPPFCKCEFIS